MTRIDAADLRGVARWAGIIGWTAMTAVLVLRRLAVAWEPRGALEIAVVALCVLAGVSLARGLLFGFKAAGVRLDWSGPLALTPGLVLLAFWLSTFADHAAPIVLVWLLVGLHEAAWVATSLSAKHSSAGGKEPIAPEASSSQKAAPEKSPAEQREWEEEEDLAPEVTQRLSRYSVDGREVISGLLRASFAPGQQVASVYASFCPPLVPNATAEVEVIEGDATAKVVEVDPEGIHIEVRRRGRLADSGETVVELAARATEP